MKHDNSVLRLLRARQRRAMFLPSCLVAICGLIAAFVAVWHYWPEKGVMPIVVGWWASIVGGTLLAALVLFLRRRRDLTRVALEADRELHDRNRLEAAAQLANSADPVAAAQREEAAHYLETHADRRRDWMPVAFAMLAGLMLAHVVLLGFWTIEFVRVGWTEPEKNQKEDGSGSPDPVAKIRWLTPDPEIKATPVEAVPLTAEAESETGLRGFSLQMEVNGVPAKSVPVKDIPETKPGTTKIDMDLYLDELEVEPFDMVSYYVTASRVSSAKLKPTASELQFVQIRPFRDDAYEVPGANGYAVQSFHLLIKLKLAQLGLIKQNFLLAHTELGHEAEPWQTENVRVGEEQSTLAEKTDQVIEFMITENVAPEVLNLLKQSQPEMKRAGGMILEEKNQPATEPQGKALSLITECEKLMIKVFAKGKVVGDPGKGPPKDPFEDKQKFELSNRLETPAGELEAIELKQAKLLDDIPEGSSNAQVVAGDSETPRGGGGEVMKEQEALEQRIEALAKNDQLPPEAREALQKAREAAKEASERLASGDREGAVEPAARALQQLQEALTKVNDAGEKAAAETLAQTQRDLNRAAAEARAAEEGKGDRRAEEAAKALATTRAELRREAERQQQGGSAAAAERMAALAGKTAGEGLMDGLKKLAEGQGQGEDSGEGKGEQPGEGKGEGKGESEAKAEGQGQGQGESSTPGQGQGQGEQAEAKGQGSGGGNARGSSAQLTELAKQAGAASLAALPRVEALKTVASNIAQAHATLQRLAERGEATSKSAEEALADLASAAQQAETLVTGTTMENDVKNILKETSTAPDLRRLSVVVLIESLERPSNNLIELLQAAMIETRRKRVITLVNPDEAPLGYRKSVADYFERLSRDYIPEKESTP